MSLAAPRLYLPAPNYLLSESWVRSAEHSRTHGKEFITQTIASRTNLAVAGLLLVGEAVLHAGCIVVHFAFSAAQVIVYPLWTHARPKRHLVMAAGHASHAGRAFFGSVATLLALARPEWTLKALKNLSLYKGNVGLLPRITDAVRKIWSHPQTNAILMGTAAIVVMAVATTQLYSYLQKTAVAAPPEPTSPDISPPDSASTHSTPNTSQPSSAIETQLPSTASEAQPIKSKSVLPSCSKYEAFDYEAPVWKRLVANTLAFYYAVSVGFTSVVWMKMGKSGMERLDLNLSRLLDRPRPNHPAPIALARPKPIAVVPLKPITEAPKLTNRRLTFDDIRWAIQASEAILHTMKTEVAEVGLQNHAHIRQDLRLAEERIQWAQAIVAKTERSDDPTHIDRLACRVLLDHNFVISRYVVIVKCIVENIYHDIVSRAPSVCNYRSNTGAAAAVVTTTVAAAAAVATPAAAAAATATVPTYPRLRTSVTRANKLLEDGIKEASDAGMSDDSWVKKYISEMRELVAQVEKSHKMGHHIDADHYAFSTLHMRYAIQHQIMKTWPLRENIHSRTNELEHRLGYWFGGRYILIGM